MVLCYAVSGGDENADLHLIRFMSGFSGSGKIRRKDLRDVCLVYSSYSLYCGDHSIIKEFPESLLLIDGISEGFLHPVGVSITVCREFMDGIKKLVHDRTDHKLSLRKN